MRFFRSSSIRYDFFISAQYRTKSFVFGPQRLQDDCKIDVFQVVELKVIFARKP
jgi:hypothetical protein